MSIGPARGDTAPLLHTLKARERIVVAVRWDPREEDAGIMDRLRGTHHQHDLDITCFVYDDQNEYIDYVGSAAIDGMDQTECIYHSGDDMTGEGNGDDEFISAELAGLPDYVTHIVFLAEIRTKHTFSDIVAPSARLADGMTDKNLLVSMIDGPEAADKTAFVFARIYRDSASSTGWSVHNIGDFPDITQVEDWGTYLKKYL
jgi:tellurium resistance protein TerZ